MSIEGLDRTRLPLDAGLGRGRLHTDHPRRRARGLVGPVGGRRRLCGHTHMQYDRMLSTGLRIVNAGSVGMPVRGSRVHWAMLGPDVEFRRHGVRRRGRPPRRSRTRCTGGERLLRGCRSSDLESTTQYFSKPIVARSYVREARRRGLGRRRERIVLIIERLAAEHSDAEIALRFRSDLELLKVSVDALRADDRRERQQGHAGALRQVPRPERTISPCRSRSSSATSTRLFSFDRRQRRFAARCGRPSRSSTARFHGGFEELVRLPGVARNTANVVSSGARTRSGHRGRHARQAAVAAGSA